MENLEVFEVVKPQGIKGELKVRILADGFFSVSDLKKVYTKDGEEKRVKSIKDAFGGFAFILLDGVLTRNDAELLRGQKYYAKKSDVKKSDTSYFIVDLIGLTVYDDNSQKIGIVSDIYKSSVDMFVIKQENGKTAYIPYLKKLKPIVNLESKTLAFEEDIKDVIYYED